MVHGNYYGIQYEIYLSKEIDFYDDLLPIWVNTRARIEIEKDKFSGKYKLVVIDYKQLDKQLYNNSLFRKFMEQNDEASYRRTYKTEQELIQKKFIMVTHYIRYVKHNSNLPEPISEEDYKLLLESWQQINSKLNENACIINGLSNKELNELETERTDLFYKLTIQRIIHNQEYFDKIKNLEKELTDQVSLSYEQNELIQKVLTHPKLEGLITWHGLSLISGFY